MKKRLVHVSVTLAVMVGILALPATPIASASPASMAAATAKAAGTGASPEGLLNADGTLNLESGFSGALNLNGWDVQIDSRRGPVFNAEQAKADAPLSAPTAGNWTAVGGGGTSPLRGYVFALAVMGSDVYVAGYFFDADDIAVADCIAKWNNTTGWSAVASTANTEAPLNGSVYALAVYDNKLYAGGEFSSINNGASYNYEGGRVAVWNGTTWASLGNGGTGLPAIGTGQVQALAVDSAGHLYVGGTFTDVSNNGTGLPTADYIAMWDPVDLTWSALGGDNGAPANGSLKAAVYAIAVDGSDDVYVGGAFHDAANAAGPIGEADHIAKWDSSLATWSALKGDGSGGGSVENGEVYALAVSGTTLYVGGSFVNVRNGSTTGLYAADYIAKWDGMDWSNLGDDGQTPDAEGPLDSSVRVLALSGPSLYVGGWFNHAHNGTTEVPEADRIAKWDTGTDTWSALGSDGAGEGSISGDVVYALATSGSVVFAGGTFFKVTDSGTDLTNAAYLAKYDSASGWSALSAGQGSLSRMVHAVTVSGLDVYVGGEFTDIVDGTGYRIPEADFIARWDGYNWWALGNNGDGHGPLNYFVYAIAASGTSLYVGGAFNGVDNGSTPVAAARYVAKYDTLTGEWSALGYGATTANSAISAGQVHALAVDSAKNLYVGGSFLNINNKGTELPAADNIAKWDSTTGDWSALGSGLGGNGSLNYPVYAIAVSGSKVYAGGSFYDVYNGSTSVTQADYVAKYDSGTWYALGGSDSGHGSLNNYVYALALSGTDLLAGGDFSNARNGSSDVAAADFIAKWNGSQWSALGGDGEDPPGGSLNNSVHAIAVFGNDVYVGGSFTNVNKGGMVLLAADRVAKWDGTNWSALGSGDGTNGSINSPAYAHVRALAMRGGTLYAGGYFFNVNNKGTTLPYADHIAAYGLPRYAIAGTVRVGGVQLSYDDGGLKKVTSTSTGSYVLTVPYYWSGAVTPTKTGCTFAPTSRAYTNVQANQTAQNYAAICSVTYQSNASHDGWVLETSENSNIGGSYSATATTFRVGDDAVKRQYRAILSFNTSGLPDTAVISSVKLKLTRQSITGGSNPFTLLQGLMIDIKKGYFSTGPGLQGLDFQATAAKQGLGPFTPTASGTGYLITLPSTAYTYINKLTGSSGLTQLRLRFKLDDNNDAVANYISFYSGNPAANKPSLIITYHVP